MAAHDPPTLQDIYRARAAIAGHVVRTPLVPSPRLTLRAGVAVALKLETLQATGAFKERGANTRLAALTPAEAEAGVITVSTGNHGRAVAHAARRLGVTAVICVSELVPALKIEAIRALGAEVRIAGATQDDCDVAAARMARDEGRTFVSAFDDGHVIAGQGTIGLELLADLPEIRTAIVPLSGGGLIGGIAIALKAANPAIRVIGVSQARAPVMVLSQRAGRPIEVAEEPTLADCLGGGIGLANRLTFGLVRDLVDDMILVDEDEIAAAVAHAFWAERQIVEGGAAVGLAALLGGKITDLAGPVAVVVSGRNIDLDKWRGIVDAHRP